MPSQKKNALTGTIISLSNRGLAILSTPKGGRFYPFTFDKIRDYRGQEASEIGLQVGSSVRYTIEGGKISEVRVELDSNALSPDPRFSPAFTRTSVESRRFKVLVRNRASSAKGRVYGSVGLKRPYRVGSASISTKQVSGSLRAISRQRVAKLNFKTVANQGMETASNEHGSGA